MSRNHDCRCCCTTVRLDQHQISSDEYPNVAVKSLAHEKVFCTAYLLFVLGCLEIVLKNLDAGVRVDEASVFRESSAGNSPFSTVAENIVVID